MRTELFAKHRWLCVLLAVLMMFGVAGTATASGGLTVSAAAVNSRPITALSFDNNRITMNVGAALQLEAQRTPIDAKGKLIWKSSKPEVISVDGGGLVMAHQKGIATVTVKSYNGQYAKCVVQAVVPTEDIKISHKKVTLNVGGTKLLTARVIPSDSSFRRVQWSSSAPAIATVRNGVVTACAKGTAVITAKTEDGVQARCIVMTRIPVSEVRFDTDRVTLQKGESYMPAVSVLPRNADDRSLTWSSDNKSVACVNSDGTVTAMGSGTAVITAESADHQKAALTVRVENPIQSILLNHTDVTLGQGESVELKVLKDPEDADDEAIYWTSGNTDVAFYSNGAVVARSVGTTVLTAQTASGLKAYCTVTVKKAPQQVTLQPSPVNLGVGESYRLNRRIPDDSASFTNEYVTADPTVCTVAQDGTVTGLKNGSTTVTVTLYNGKSASATVYVKSAPVEMTLDYYQLAMGRGESFRLYTHVDGKHASQTRLFVSDKPSVVKVDEKGMMTALQPGTAIVTARTYNGVSADCVVTVKEAPDYLVINGPYKMTVGSSQKIKLEFPDNAASAAVRFTSSNSGICSVDSNGVLTANAVGEVTVSATAFNGKTTSCRIRVGKSPTALYLYTPRLQLKVGRQFKLDYYLPKDEVVASTFFSSDNQRVCSVDQGGNLKALSEGSAVITVMTQNGKRAECRVTVSGSSSGYEHHALSSVVTPIGQYPELPTGCEITALATVLRYFGYAVDKCVLSDNYLEKGDAWGTDFWEKFCGEPRSQYSYGCYAPVIKKAADKYLREKNSALSAVDLTGTDAEELFSYTDRGIPVMVWVTINMVQGYYTDSWYANGKKLTWYANEHCMVLLGYEGNVVYMSDPTSGTITTYDKELFKTRYKELFKQAVVVR